MDDLQISRSRRANDIRTIVLAIAGLSICSIAAGARSRGFLESDGATHYIFARHAFAQPGYFLDVWGRPLCTGLFALPARLAGLIGVRITSLVLAIGCGLVAYRIALMQKYRWPALALIFTIGQPLVFLHSFSELTELPFALVIGLAMLAYQSRRWGAMAFFLAIAPLGRPEGFAFLLLGAAALLAHRQWKWILLLPGGLIAWSWIGHELVGLAENPWWRWLADHWPYETGSAYPSGSIFHFFLALPVIVGPFALPALWIGLEQNLRIPLKTPGGIRAFLGDHARRVDFILAALPLAVLLGHSVLYRLGKMSSNGELRYLVIVAPMWGVLCARGWGWIFSRMRWRRPVSWAALAVVLPGLVNFYWRVLPLGDSTSWQEAQRVIAWYQSPASAEIRAKYPRILTNHPGVFYYLDISPTDRRYVEPWSAATVAHPPAGVILFWDSDFCLFNADSRYVAPLELVERSGWIRDTRAEGKTDVAGMPPGGDQWRIYRSPVEVDEEK